LRTTISAVYAEKCRSTARLCERPCNELVAQPARHVGGPEAFQPRSCFDFAICLSTPVAQGAISCSVDGRSLPLSSPSVSLLCCWPSSGRSTSIRHILNLSVFLLQCPLHLEIGLTFALQSLLLVVADDTGVHCLWNVRYVVNSKMVQEQAYSFLDFLPVVDSCDNANGTYAGRSQCYL